MNVTPAAIARLASQSPNLMVDSHGWVIPRPDGMKKPCGGPSVCRECHLEYLALQTTDRITVMEGWRLAPGDKVLLIAPPNMPQDYIDTLGQQLSRDFPEVGITIVKGFTGLTVHRSDPNESLANS